MQWSLAEVAPSTVSRGEVRMATLFQVALALLLIMNLGRIPVFSTGGRDVPILVNDLVVAALIGAGALAMATHRRFRIDATAGIALLFVGLGAISAVLAVPRFGLTSGNVLISMGYLARWVFYLAVYVVAVNTLKATDTERVWGALEAMILMFAAFGVFQAAFLPGFAQMVYPDSRAYLDWDPQGHRLVSTVLDPNFAGAAIDIGLLVLFARLAAGAKVSGWKMVLLLTALLLTASRSSILAFLVGGAVVLVVRGLSKRVLRGLGAAFVLLLLALPKLLAFAKSYNKLSLSDASALARITNWLNGWRILRDHWVIGIGFNTWGFVGERYGMLRLNAATYGIEGGLFFVAVMTGVVGLVLYVAMLASIGLNARQVWRSRAPAEARGLAIGAAATIPMIVVHSLFTNSLFQPFLMEALWVVWALPFVYRAR